MADEHEAALRKALRHNLAELVRHGLQVWHIADVCDDLVGLRIVASRVNLPEDASEDKREAANAKALKKVLGEAVDKLRRKERRVLKLVLPLDKDYLGKSLKERRAAAAKAIKDGKNAVKPGTIRTYYEPKALDALASALLKMEHDHRSKATSAGDGGTDVKE